MRLRSFSSSSVLALPSSALLAAVLAFAAALAAPACGSSDDSSQPGGPEAGSGDGPAQDAGPLQGLVSITVTPAKASLVAGDHPTKQTFTAQGKFVDGSSRDVTALVTWSASPPAVLSANGPVASPAGAVGGDATMNAISGSITGTATVHVTLVANVIAPGAPMGAPSQLGADAGTSDPTIASAVVYPLDGVLVPPNLDPMEIQWQPAAGTTLFDVHVDGAAIDLHVFTPCNPVPSSGGCSLVPDAATWSSIVETLRGGDPATLTVLAVGATPGKIGVSAPVSVQFASTDVKGGLYYFNTHAAMGADGGTEQPGIYRYDFDKNQVGPFYTAENCAGCHALSKDGTKMLAPICTLERGCGRPLQLAVVDVATKAVVTPPVPVGDSDTQTWTPDDKFYVTTPTCAAYDTGNVHACTQDSGGVMTLIDASNNTRVGAVPVAPGTLYPSFSNAGTKLVYARGNPYDGPLVMQKSDLLTLDFTESPTPTWGQEKVLLKSSGENNYHPSFSPDDAWVVYAQSHCDAGDDPNVCDTYDDPTARVFVVPAAGGTPIELKLGNGPYAGAAPPRLDNSWPKWSPFKGTYKGGDIFWITFSSVRDYGFRTPVAAGQTHVRQLWLVGFDVAKAKAGKDPSFAAVWLPFQETTTSNHIGQWTEKVVGQVK